MRMLTTLFVLPAQSARRVRVRNRRKKKSMLSQLTQPVNHCVTLAHTQEFLCKIFRSLENLKAIQVFSETRCSTSD